jgi:putative FmdB family regulatory protein
MPIYEYMCLECGKLAEVFLRTTDDEDVRCPSCGSSKLDKLVSASYTVATGAPTPGATCCGRGERCERPPCSLDNTCRRDNR